MVSGIYPPDIGGPASFIPTLAHYLSQNGVEVIVITLGDVPFYERECDSSWVVLRVGRGLNIVLRQLVTVFLIVRYAIKSDLIFSNTLDFEAFLASQFTCKRHIVKVVGDLAWERSRVNSLFEGDIEDFQSEVVQSFRLKLYKLYRSIPVRKATSVIVPSNYLRKLILKWRVNVSSISVIKNTVTSPLDRLKKSKILKFPAKILVVSRLVPYKGITEIIREVARLKHDVNLHIIGDGPEREPLQDICSQTGVICKFHGDISKQMVYHHMKEATLLIQNSSYEGFPHVVAEAMVNGLPVIASNVGGTSELIRHEFNGLLFDRKTPSQIFECTNSLLSDQILYDYIANNALKTSKVFCDTEKMCGQYLKLFKT